MSKAIENTGYVSKFELSVIKPVKGKPGELVFSATVYAETVSDAVKKLRSEVEGSGWIVVQTASLHTPANENEEPSQMAKDIVAALRARAA